MIVYAGSSSVGERYFLLQLEVVSSSLRITPFFFFSHFFLLALLTLEIETCEFFSSLNSNDRSKERLIYSQSTDISHQAVE